jgi:hypothetical protein
MTRAAATPRWSRLVALLPAVVSCSEPRLASVDAGTADRELVRAPTFPEALDAGAGNSRCSARSETPGRRQVRGR